MRAGRASSIIEDMRLDSHRSAVVLTAVLSSVTLLGAGCMFDSSNAIPHGGGGAPATTSPTIASSSSTSGSGGSGGAGGWGGATGGGGTSVTTSSSSETTPGELGASCGGATECASGHCVDGVCCDSACEGVCEACSGAGHCGPVAAGDDPRSDCAESAPRSCGTTGACDGAGHCARYDATTVCGDASCTAGVAVAVSLCDGAGTCKVGNKTTCKLGCTLDVCTSDCTPTSCSSDKYCAASGVCVAKTKNGATCSVASTCQSGFCVDGVCCNSACEGACKVCSKDLGATQDGQCSNVDVGDDPKNLCSDEGASTCGHSGVCDGAGACALYGDTTVCETRCESGKITKKTCSGAGTCDATGTSASCNGYACESATACKTSCAAATDCASGYTCSASQCIAAPPTPP